MTVPANQVLTGDAPSVASFACMCCSVGDIVHYLAVRVRIIDTLGPATIQPVVAARHVATTLKDDLRAVLCAIGDDPTSRDALDYGFVARFVPIADADYDDIRMMVAAAEEAGFLVLR